MDATSQFVFRAPQSFIDETAEAARSSGMSRSEYARRAIEAANVQAMQSRMAVLSRQLADQGAVESEALDESTPDGLVP